MILRFSTWGLLVPLRARWYQIYLYYYKKNKNMGLFTNSTGVKPWVNVAGQILGGALGIGQSIAQFQTHNKQNRLQREHERALADFAYNKDLEMWNRANKYNTPLMQMKRFKEAGLNPNMIYGSKSGITGNTVAQMPKYSPPRQNFDVRFPNVAQNIQSFQNLNLRQAQIDNIRSRTELNTQQQAIRRVEEQYSGFMTGEQAIKDQSGKRWSWRELLTADGATLRKVRGISPRVMKGVYEMRRELYSTQTAGYERDVAKWKSWLSSNGLTPSDDTITRLLYNIYKDDPKTAQTISMIMYSARELTNVIGNVSKFGILAKNPGVRRAGQSKNGKQGIFKSGNWQNQKTGEIRTIR